LFLALKLSKEGYYNGNPQAILEAPGYLIMEIIKYESSLSEYLDVYKEINEC